MIYLGDLESAITSPQSWSSILLLSPVPLFVPENHISLHTLIILDRQWHRLRVVYMDVLLYYNASLYYASFFYKYYRCHNFRHILILHSWQLQLYLTVNIVSRKTYSMLHSVWWELKFLLWSNEQVYLTGPSVKNFCVNVFFNVFLLASSWSPMANQHFVIHLVFLCFQLVWQIGTLLTLT